MILFKDTNSEHLSVPWGPAAAPAVAGGRRGSRSGVRY